MPPAWTLYLASDDADATAKPITDAGGTMLLPPGDVGPLGRLCVAADPTGAVFGVWQAGGHIGAELHSEPGGLTWEDLRTPDPDYGQGLLHGGVRLRDARAGDGRPRTTPPSPCPATTAAPLGGMGPCWRAEGTPPHWLSTSASPTPDAALAAAVAAGGTSADARARLAVRDDGHGDGPVRRDFHCRADRRVEARRRSGKRVAPARTLVA